MVFQGVRGLAYKQGRWIGSQTSWWINSVAGRQSVNMIGELPRALSIGIDLQIRKWTG